MRICQPASWPSNHRELSDSWAEWLSVVESLERRIRVVDGIRRTLAERYYAGHDVLFVDAADDWKGHVEQVDRGGTSLCSGRSQRLLP
jgi:hypothetical protein